MAIATVTLNIGVDNLTNLSNQLLARKAMLLDELDQLNQNIDAIAKAIASTQRRETLVKSESDPWKSYMVALDKDGYDCSCPSFEFQQGVDAFGYCKHIRRVISEGRFA